jgi:hypothetical protein
VAGNEAAEHGITGPEQGRERQQQIRLIEQAAARAASRLEACPGMTLAFPGLQQ